MPAAGKRERKRRWSMGIGVVLIATAAASAGLWGATRLFRGPLAPAEDAYRGADYSRALAGARERLRATPNDVAARRLMARASARLGRDEVALRTYDRLGRQALQAEDFYLVGKAMLRLGRTDAAQDALESAYRLEPDNSEAAYELARLYAGSDRLTAAEAIIGRLSEQPRWRARASTMLGVLRERASNAQGTINAFRDALRRDPKLTGAIATPAQVRKSMARALLMLRRPDEARRQLEIVLHAANDPEASWLLSRAALQSGDLIAAEFARKEAGDYGKDQPQAFEPAPYTGAAACVECHQDIHRLAGGTRHAKTYRPRSDLEDFPLPDGPITDPANARVVHTLERQGDRVVLESRIDGAVRRALLEFAVGSGDRGLTPVARDDRGQMRELRLSYYGDIKGWDRTMGRPAHPAHEGDYLGEPLTEDSVRRCLDCHVTSFRATLDQTGPVAGDRGIGCERCHGPAGNHILAIAAKFSEPAIGRPRLASPEQVTNLCGQCHRPRNREVSPSDADAVRFQAATLPWSRCYVATNGAIGCVTCHSPHRDADTSSDYYEARCLGCHAPTAPPAAPAETHRTRHLATLPEGIPRVPCPVNPARDCIECHMPSVTSAAPHTVFTDHFIRVHPRVTASGTKKASPAR